jgi:hypothetical protein
MQTSIEQRAWTLILIELALVAQLGCRGTDADLSGAPWALGHAVSAAREVGLPFRAADVVPGPPVLDHENGAEAIRRLRRALTAHPVRDLAAPTSLDESELAESVRANSELLAAAETAARFERLDFRRDWDLGPLLQFPEHRAVLPAALVLNARAKLKALRGDDAGCLSDLRSSRSLGKLAAQDPVISGLLAAAAVEDSALQTLVQVAWVWRDRPERLEGLRAFVDEDFSPSLARSLRGEMYKAVALARNFERFTMANGSLVGSIEPERVLRYDLPSDPSCQARLSALLRAWVAAYASALEPVAPKRDVARRFTWSGPFPSGTGRWSAWKTVSNPALLAASDAVEALEGRQSVIRASLEVLLWRSRHGRWPLSLAEASVALDDPFDFKPIRYRLEGGSVSLWSIGPDRKDDGGAVSIRGLLTPSEESEGLQGDLVVEWPPSE